MDSNFFMTLESMKILRVLTDVWLPDFKFGPGRCAMTLAKTPWYWETVTRNIALVADWGEDFSIRHLVMPNHVECCTYPVLEWIAERVPAAPVNVMAQFHPDNFCDPASAKYRDKYAEIARRFDPTISENDLPGTGDDMALFQIIPTWREIAWRNAERLVSAPSAEARARVAAEIEAYAASQAETLRASYQYGLLGSSAARDAYCAAHHDDP
jgi:hypothetical protein